MEQRKFPDVTTVQLFFFSNGPCTRYSVEAFPFFALKFERGALQGKPGVTLRPVMAKELQMA